MLLRTLRGAERDTRYCHSAGDADKVKNVVVYGDPDGGDTADASQSDHRQCRRSTIRHFGTEQRNGLGQHHDYQFQFVIPIVGTTITMPSYTTTLTGESVGFDSGQHVSGVDQRMTEG